MMLSIRVSAFGIITEGHQHDDKGFVATPQLVTGCTRMDASRWPRDAGMLCESACSKVFLLLRVLE